MIYTNTINIQSMMNILMKHVQGPYLLMGLLLIAIVLYGNYSNL
jgi:hypothetical protein